MEVMDVKKQTFKELQDIVKKEDCIFATNTSSLSITEIGAGISHPVIGMHFFNPAPVMKLVEVIRGENTTDEIREIIGAESLGYMKLEDLQSMVGELPICRACLDGKYPMDITGHTEDKKQ